MTPAIMAMPMRGPTTTPAIHALDPDELFLESGEAVEEAGWLLAMSADLSIVCYYLRFSEIDAGTCL